LGVVPLRELPEWRPAGSCLASPQVLGQVGRQPGLEHLDHLGQDAARPVSRPPDSRTCATAPAHPPVAEQSVHTGHPSGPGRGTPERAIVLCADEKSQVQAELGSR
jgi:hypothetical protein